MKERISKLSLSEIRIALRYYEDEVYEAGLAAHTSFCYLTHARNFVRWLHGDFKPGVQKRGERITQKTLDKRTKSCETCKK